MKTLHFLSITLAASCLFLSAIGTPLFAQSSLISTTVTSADHHPPAMGRDFWFAIPSNQWGEQQSGTYIEVNVTSPRNTTAYVETEGTLVPLSIQATRVTSYKLPEYFEMESSGIVDDKAIHVYSNDADISVTFMSHQPFSSEGTAVIPGVGWGTDYVVAAFESFFPHGVNDTLDLPSECVVVANEDNTEVDITPSCNCRQSLLGNIFGKSPSDTLVVYDAGQTYSWTLNRGQTLQLMPVKSTDKDNFDLTGTIIHASQPVGVIGASMDANIPADYPLPDFVCEMLPPVRTWGETYYSTNWIQPPGSLDDYTRYLFISSDSNQTIFRHDCVTGDHVECVIPKKFGIYWDELESGQKFWSGEPFQVIAYMNGGRYPGAIDGQGDPAECILNAWQDSMDTTILQMPPSENNIIPYTNYANIVVNVADAFHTYFDGQKILGGKGAQCVDDTFEIFNIPKIAPGAHLVENRYEAETGKKSHGGAGVYYYGYGYNESYAMSPPTMFATFRSPDTSAPKATVLNECFITYVHLADSGLLPDGIHSQSGLAMIRLDSSYNMNYMLDVPNFIEGSGVDTSGYGFFPIDETREGYLRVEVYDLAGNETIITSIYKPVVDSIFPPLINLGVTAPPITNYGYDTIYNDGLTTINFTSIKLKYGDQGFRIDSADMSPLAPGKWRIIKISFSALKSTKAVDTVEVSTSCNEIQAAVIGSGGAADFMVTSYHWNNVILTSPPPATCYQGTLRILNLGNQPIIIDSGYWPDRHFTAISTFPFTLPPAPASYTFNVQYCPDSGSLNHPDRTQGVWYSHNVLAPGTTNPDPRFDSLVGNAIAPSETFGSDIDTTVSCNNLDPLITLNFTITATGRAGTVIKRVAQSDTTDFTNLSGYLNSNGDSWNPTSTEQPLPAGQSATISVQFSLNSGKTSAVDFLTAIDGNNDTIGTVRASITVDNSTASLSPDSLVFGPIQFQSASGNTTESFQIQNTSGTALPVDYVIFDPGQPYNNSFTLTTSPAYPDTLAVGQSMTVTIHFNDSASSDLVQSTMVDIASPTCSVLTENIIAKLAGSSVAEPNTSEARATITSPDGRLIQIYVPDETGPNSFELFNILGEDLLRANLSSETTTLDAGVLSKGIYFYRINSGQTGKLILGN